MKMYVLVGVVPLKLHVGAIHMISYLKPGAIERKQVRKSFARPLAQLFPPVCA